jgi:uncharacterized protein (DUF2147 family)
MRKAVLLVAVVAFVPALAAEQSPDAIVGSWKPADHEVAVKIIKAGATYTGSAIGSDGQTQEIFKALSWDAAAQVWKGEVYAPKRKSYFPAVVRLQGSDSFVLTAGSGAFSKETTWTRQRSN